MKEIYCFQCRRYKRADLFCETVKKNRAICLSCSSQTNKVASRTQAEKDAHHNQNVSNGKRYKKPFSKEQIKKLTGE